MHTTCKHIRTAIGEVLAIFLSSHKQKFPKVFRTNPWCKPKPNAYTSAKTLTQVFSVVRKSNFKIG
jgi:hypothetical protein